MVPRLPIQYPLLRGTQRYVTDRLDGTYDPLVFGGVSHFAH
jgi:hypothetical protein